MIYDINRGIEFPRSTPNNCYYYVCCRLSAVQWIIVKDNHIEQSFLSSVSYIKI